MEACFMCQSPVSVSVSSGCSHQYCDGCFKSLTLESLANDPYKIISCPECGISMPKQSLYTLFGGVNNYSAIHNGFEKFDCSLCYLEKLIKDSIYIGCEHLYCRTCVNMYVGEKARTNDFEEGISCPECDHFIEDEVLREVLTRSEFEMFKKVLKAKNSSVKVVPQVYRWCLFCDKCVIADSDSTEYFCIRCQKNFCIRCKEIVHASECRAVDFDSDKIRASFKPDTVVPEDIAKCPICLNAVSLNKGCNALRCPWPCCKSTIFCVLCNNVLDIKDHFSHYSKEGPFGKTCNFLDSMTK